jgi:hypothetical protein
VSPAAVGLLRRSLTSNYSLIASILLSAQKVRLCSIDTDQAEFYILTAFLQIAAHCPAVETVTGCRGRKGKSFLRWTSLRE